MRDLIPDLISRDGERPVTRTLDEEEFGLELARKLREEVDEFCETGAVEEPADALEDIRARKCLERGGFEQRIFLVETHACTGLDG